jgi:hypothetical protein
VWLGACVSAAVCEVGGKLLWVWKGDLSSGMVSLLDICIWIGVHGWIAINDNSQATQEVLDGRIGCPWRRRAVWLAVHDTNESFLKMKTTPVSTLFKLW